MGELKSSPVLFCACNAGMSPVSRIAVDIVLLPEQEMMDYAIAANAELVRKFGGGIVLDKENCLPHISLAMGCISRGDIDDLGKILSLLTAIVPIRLKLAGIGSSVNPSGQIVSVLLVERSSRLQKLHQKISDVVKPWFSYDVTEDMIAGGRADGSTLQWIRDYRAKSSYSNFLPHITVGYGDLAELALPADFAVSQLGLCHLGNHCTCRKILWSGEV